MCARATPYGEIVQEMDLPSVGKPQTIGFQHPIAMLVTAAQECDAFASCMIQAIETYGEPTPSKPWRLIWYTDEVGINPISLGTDPRKKHGCYWSFLEFGPRLLCTELVWFIAAAVRSKVVNKMLGGVTHLNKLLLRTFFVDDRGSFRSGVWIHIRGLD